MSNSLPAFQLVLIPKLPAFANIGPGVHDSFLAGFVPPISWTHNVVALADVVLRAPT